MEKIYVAEGQTSLKSNILSCLSVSLIMSIIFAIFVYFYDQSIYFSLIVFLITFVFVFVILFFLLKKGQISDVQLNEIGENYKLLAELNYPPSDIRIKFLNVIPIIVPCVFLIVGIWSLTAKEYLISWLSFGLIIPFGIMYYLLNFKLKIDCKITNKGIIIGSLLSKPTLITWQNISSYELLDSIVYLSLTNISTKPRFPVLDQQEKIIKILNYYLTKN